MPVIEHYSKQSKVATVRLPFSRSKTSFISYFACQIDATATIDEVHDKAKQVVGKIFAGRNITA